MDSESSGEREDRREAGAEQKGAQAREQAETQAP